MLIAFVIRDGRLEQTPLSLDEGEIGSEQMGQIVWVDLSEPTEEERAWVERQFGLELPEYREMNDIEPSARLYEDEDGLHLHSYFLSDLEEQSRNITVAFDILGGRLFTLHEDDLSTFRLFRLRARRQVGLVKDVTDIIVGLFEAKVEHLADTLEQIYSDLEHVSHQVLTEADPDMEDVLSELAEQEDLNGKARLILLDTRRSLSFLLRYGFAGSARGEDIREILRDVESLTSHTGFLFDKVNFLMDAAMGFINIEQNKIVKIFSIAAVVFMPPTLVASMYGMNFHHMPELDWTYGYPIAIGLMILAGIAPYVFFKKKGWL
ncbi:magnesium/cobalt transporter CorA [Plasticicumulans acidivorans]|uniref:Magnesium transport protein CorA n=1 Tax=Plasticicumulans acidivorans TaxID=886464 RepID=A0A317MS42_9GAMM|nr:magnesium/cobalt transporter CorA [Plasticicumulans acidivorans]PWV58846.1 magnesium transporter [Plasticicumulans acidivorans]